MILSRSLKWIGGVLLTLTLLITVLLTLFDGNWLRGPATRMVTQKTGRTLAINGDLQVKFGWPLVRVSAADVTFANPSWAKEKQMIAADTLQFTLDLPRLIRRQIVMPELHLGHATVFLEQGTGGRRNWLLDRNQQDEKARIEIVRLTIEQGKIDYDDPERETSIQAEVSTRGKGQDGVAADGVSFTAKGQYVGLPLKASGSGGPALALRQDSTPYPLKIDASIGRTVLQAEGSITDLTKFSAIDMRLAIRGDSLAQLFPLLGIALPETRAYSSSGHLTHSAQRWTYEAFSGRIGKSDIAGNVQVDVGGKRPYLHGEVLSQLLDFADLGPLIGAKQGSAGKPATSQSGTGQGATIPKTAGRHVLPELPFHTERWDSVDADLKFSAKTIHRAKELPIDNLVTRLQLRDSVLTLDPLDFGVAGGNLAGTVSLNGRADPIQAHIKVRVRKMLISELFPTFDRNKTSIGQVNGEIDLAGHGNAVSGMLANADGKVALVIAGGKISRLMMESVGLHLWEILQLKVTGDQIIGIRCGVADFKVKNGVMTTNTLVLDTDVTHIGGTGTIDLGKETLDLILTPETKKTSPVALRGPIHIRGSLGKPDVSVDTAQVATRSLGAIALGVVNPLLSLLALVETGPGIDSDCGRLIREAQAPAQGAVQQHSKISKPAKQ